MIKNVEDKSLIQLKVLNSDDVLPFFLQEAQVTYVEKTPSKNDEVLIPLFKETEQSHEITTTVPLSKMFEFILIITCRNLNNLAKNWLKTKVEIKYMSLIKTQ